MGSWAYRSLLCLILAGLLPGCATVPLDSARRNFNTGKLEEADRDLATLPDNADTVMNLMERGMIRHVRRDYTNSTLDWQRALRLETELETHSASRAGASMLVNDTVLNFRGYPFERTYLHLYLARNYLAQGLWEDAAVESRAIALAMQNLDGFPDDAMSHYMAGFGLELCSDFSNAALQYRQVARLAPWAGIDERSGRFLQPGNTNQAPALPPGSCELVCLIDFDGGNGMVPHHADLYTGDQFLGTSRTLSDILDLQIASSERMQLRHTAKTLGRLALKGAIAMAAAAKDSDLGNMVWGMLLAMETEDLRRWSTLPVRLAVARVTCPEHLQEVSIDFKTASGITIKRVTLLPPLLRRGRIYVAECRDHP